jgi:SAM-dependent methyltransferase
MNMEAPFQSGATAALCPVCGTDSPAYRTLSSAFLKEELSKYYVTSPPAAFGFRDYEMHRCQQCTLEFASPLVEGDAVFYDWITRHSTYYPKERWEWPEVKKRLVVTPPRPLRVLELGSGSGIFLEFIRDLKNVKAVGLDVVASSVEQCGAKGLEVHAETLGAYARNPNRAFRSFDAIVAFHCLQHVADPKGLLVDMLQLLAPGGRIFLTTPYSPMSFETQWFDPLNHPPHHVTRWNRAAYLALAKPFGLDVALSMPSPPSLFDRVASAFNFAWNSPQRLQARNEILRCALKKPRLLLSEFFRQMRRERVGSAVAADVVLVQFSRIGDRR